MKTNNSILKENRNYKSSVFEDLFYEDITAEENDISLYNALHDEKLPEGTVVRKIRIENILYMNFKNDISFSAGDKVLVFGEHQSTINYNMPLRSLMYSGRAYEQLVSLEDRYRRALVKIPTPEFYTFYNGTEPYPDEQILKLSDAFITKPVYNSMELSVKVINIRKDKKHKVLGDCKVLREYTEFVECVQKYRLLNKPDAIELAIKESINNGILKEYLERKGSEVVNMLVAEYDYATDIKIQREEAEIQGRKQGIEQGIEQGKILTKQEDLIELLRGYGSVPETLIQCINHQDNLDILSNWLKLLISSKSIKEFSEKINL